MRTIARTTETASKNWSVPRVDRITQYPVAKRALERPPFPNPRRGPFSTSLVFERCVAFSPPASAALPSCSLASSFLQGQPSERGEGKPAPMIVDRGGCSIRYRDGLATTIDLAARTFLEGVAAAAQQLPKNLPPSQVVSLYLVHKRIPPIFFTRPRITASATPFCRSQAQWPASRPRKHIAAISIASFQ